MKKFPQKTIQRAFFYIRALDDFILKNQEFVSSKELSEITGVTDVQIRKDISNFGRVGKPRVGYNAQVLKTVLENFVFQNVVHVVLFGVGNLGKAILKYPGFHQEKIKIVAAFEKDKKKISKKIQGVQVYSIRDAKRIISQKHAEIGVIAVPKEYSQEMADIMVLSGLKGIVNFSPTQVKVPENVVVKDIDLTIEFLSLFCDIV